MRVSGDVLAAYADQAADYERRTALYQEWRELLVALVAAVHAPFVRDFTGFDRPWRQLAELVDDLRVTEVAFGTGYLALARAPNR